MIIELAISISLSLNPDSTWCPVVDHPHKKHFRIGQWMKKDGVWQRARTCDKKGCKNYKLKQRQYKTKL